MIPTRDDPLGGSRGMRGSSKGDLASRSSDVRLARKEACEHPGRMLALCAFSKRRNAERGLLRAYLHRHRGARASACRAADRDLPGREAAGRRWQGGATVPHALHARGHPAAGRDRRVGFHALRTGHDGPAAARLHGFRGRPLCTPSGDLQRPPVQRAPRVCSAPRTPRTPRKRRSASAASRARRAARAGSASTRCIRATSTRSRVSITSTPSTRSSSTSSRAAWSAFRRNFCRRYRSDLVESFPFVMQGFHSDRGSEYVNYQVDALLEKLHVAEFTKSRPRRSNLNIQIGSLAGPSCCEARCSAKGPAAPRAWTRQPAQALPQPLQLGHAQPKPACHVERQGGCPPRQFKASSSNLPRNHESNAAPVSIALLGTSRLCCNKASTSPVRLATSVKPGRGRGCGCV